MGDAEGGIEEKEAAVHEACTQTAHHGVRRDEGDHAVVEGPKVLRERAHDLESACQRMGREERDHGAG